MADLAAHSVPPPTRKPEPASFSRRMRPWQWVVLDALVALMFLLPFGSSRSRAPAHQNPWLSLLVLGVTLAFLARRRFPMTVCLLLTAATVTLATAGAPYDSYGPFAMMFALYTVATTRSGRSTTLASAAVLTVALVILTSLHYPASVTALSGVAIGVAPSLTGYVVRQQRQYRAAMAAVRARRIEAEVTSRMADERLRIARELHDVVAHALSLITVQAGVAVFRQHEADQMRATLTAIEETGRSAMIDMRQLLGVLRNTPAPDADQLSTPDREQNREPDRAPVPDLLDLGTLISQAAQAGLHISLREEGERRVIPAAVGLAVYRIVQESLTNILRHARTTSGSVLLSFAPHQLAVIIANPPPPDGLPPAPPGTPGHGLRGMAERTALFGGTFSAGPSSDGGFTVAARFPA
ncbi:sensor histidine kinase [Catenulispora rubra]|uniref:sensor histidine kinase n=1 Tax=Catenulispora rubra TaxID=280293 RepID=UPI0018925C69|nr:histidine kinase [Catenulispora rubra]